MSDTQAAPASEAPANLEAIQARAQTCQDEIQQILVKHRCQLVPMLTSEHVGEGPTTRLLLGATYGVIPEEAMQ